MGTVCGMRFHVVGKWAATVGVALLAVGSATCALAEESTATPPAWAWPDAALEATCAAVGTDGTIYVGTLRRGVGIEAQA